MEHFVKKGQKYSQLPADSKINEQYVAQDEKVEKRRSLKSFVLNTNSLILFVAIIFGSVGFGLGQYFHHQREDSSIIKGT
jgi:hypothetical protein